MTVFSDTFDTATPAGGNTPTEADDRMRETKAATQERENVDHYWPKTGTEVSDADAGEHRKVTLRTGSAPSAVADKGFVYAKDVSAKAELFYRDEDGDEVQITTGGIIKLTSAALLAILANNTFLTAVDQAGSGTVNLIKAGTNDLATLPDSAEMASSAAPVEDEAIANKKYVDDKTDPTYSGGESHTFIGGLIFKHGDITVPANSTVEVTYGVAFPTEFISTQATLKTSTATVESPAHARSKSGSTTTVLQVTNAHNVTTNVYWQAWGR